MGERDAAFLTELGDQAAITAEYFERHLQANIAQVVDFRQIRLEVIVRRTDGDGRGEAADYRQSQSELEKLPKPLHALDHRTWSWGMAPINRLKRAAILARNPKRLAVESHLARLPRECPMTKSPDEPESGMNHATGIARKANAARGFQFLLKL